MKTPLIIGLLLSSTANAQVYQPCCGLHSHNIDMQAQQQMYQQQQRYIEQQQLQEQRRQTQQMQQDYEQRERHMQMQNRLFNSEKRGYY